MICAVAVAVGSALLPSVGVITPLLARRSIGGPLSRRFPGGMPPRLVAVSWTVSGCALGYLALHATRILSW